VEGLKAKRHTTSTPFAAQSLSVINTNDATNIQNKETKKGKLMP